MNSLESIRRAGVSIFSSLRLTLSAIASSARHRSTSELVALIKDGSPLELFIKGLLSAAFWVLVLAPVLIVPAFYLLVSLK